MTTRVDIVLDDPLTKMLTNLLERPQSHPWEGYRGKMVIGSWHRISKLNIGLISEVDVSGALYTARYINRIIQIFTSLVILLVLCIIITLCMPRKS